MPEGIFELSIGDPRLGIFAPDGAVEAWPELSLLNRPYERVNATIQRIPDTDYFVVVPPDRGRFVDEVKLV